MTGRKYEKYCKVMVAFMCSFELMAFRHNYTWRVRLFAIMYSFEIDGLNGLPDRDSKTAYQLDEIVNTVFIIL